MNDHERKGVLKTNSENPDVHPLASQLFLCKAAAFARVC